MLVGTSWLVVQACAFAGGLLAVALALGLAGLCRGDRQLVLILSGVISTALFTALLAAAKYVADPKDKLPAITYWLMAPKKPLKADNSGQAWAYSRRSVRSSQPVQATT